MDSKRQSDVEILEALSKLHILVVDDSDFDRTLLVSILKKIGVQSIQTAENGSIAIQKIETGHVIRKPFDIVFTDWKMPTQDGLNLLRWIKTNTKYKNLAVVVTTGVSDEDGVKQFIKHGVDGFIVKPVNYDMVYKKLCTLRKTAGKRVG